MIDKKVNINEKKNENLSLVSNIITKLVFVFIKTNF